MVLLSFLWIAAPKIFYWQLFVLDFVSCYGILFRPSFVVMPAHARRPSSARLPTPDFVPAGSVVFGCAPLLLLSVRLQPLLLSPHTISTSLTLIIPLNLIFWFAAIHICE